MGRLYPERRVVLLTAALVWGAHGVAGQTVPKVVDVGHPLSATDPSWSGDEVFQRTATAALEKDGVAMGTFSSDEHFGTHLDAPSHFAPEGWTVDEIPVDRLVRPGVCISMVEQVARNEDYRLSVEDIERFEAAHGEIPEGAIVLVATGWDRKWSAPERYMNRRDGVLHFPGISVEAASYLARRRRVAGIGIDTPSVDYGPSKNFETHRTTMPANVYHVENAANLVSLPPGGFTVVVAPIALVGGSGGPTRIFALFY